MKDLKARERGVAGVDSQMKTLVEMKSDLMGKTPASQRAADRELTASEEAALERWKEGEKKQVNLLIKEKKMFMIY